LINEIKILYKKKSFREAKKPENSDDTESSSNEEEKKNCIENQNSLIESVMSWRNKQNLEQLPVVAEIETNKADIPAKIADNKEEKEKEKDNEILTPTKQTTNSAAAEKLEFITINQVLINIEEKYSEYLSLFNKEWESEVVRDKWKAFIKENTQVENFATSILLLNERFKNPYKIDDDEEEEGEVDDKNKENKKEIIFDSVCINKTTTEPYFLLKKENNGVVNELKILKLNRNKILAPKSMLS